MKRRYLKDVTTLPDYILQVDFVSGSRLLLDMKPYLDKIRFLSLADKNVWSSAVTNGIFVRFGDVELSTMKYCPWQNRNTNAALRKGRNAG